MYSAQRFALLISFGLSITLTSVSWAQLSVSITSPTSGSCVPNDPVIQPGGTPGDTPEFVPSNVKLSLVIVEPNGDQVSLSATVNGVPVELNTQSVFTDGGGASTLIEFVSILADEVEDGINQTLSLTVTSPAGQATDTVTFDLDRTPPTLSFNAAQLELLDACVANAADEILTITPDALDQFDPLPTVIVTDSQEACTLTRVITAQDHCGEGNMQEVVFQIKRPAIDNADIYFSGAEEGEYYLETTAYYGVLNDNCFIADATLSSDGGEAVPISSGTILDTPGSYELSVTATDCIGNTESEQVNFEILEQPFAATGGPYEIQQGQVLILDGNQSFCPPELGGIIEYSWDFDLFDDGDGGYRYLGDTVEFIPYNGVPFDDGTYTVGLRVETFSGQVRYDNTEVVVLDAPPNCDAGGPYEVQQGALLTFDGSGSSPGIESEQIIGYQWDFGEVEGDLDERFGFSLSRPGYRYSDEGEYTVSLTVYDIDSDCTTEASVIVNDIDPIVRDLNVVDPAPYREGTAITFSAGTTSAGSPAEPIVRFIWDWGDGSEPTRSLEGSELRRPSHLFQDSGSFNVCLTVQDEDSEDTDCLPIEIEDIRPIARLDGDLFAIEGEPASFSIAGTRAGDAADPLSFMIIQWGDGTETRLEGEQLTQTDLTHTFIQDGTLTIRLLVYDEEETDPSIAELELYVDDVRPTPVITEPLQIAEGLEATWSAEQSTAGAESDPITSYQWDWGDGSTSTGMTPTHSYADNGVYTVRLTVTDSDGSPSTITRFINVANRPPYQAEILVDRTTFDYGERVRFEVQFEDVPSDTVQIFWRMGSGNATYSNQRIVEHEYRELGIFTIRVLLTDDDGGETTVELDVEVTPAGPRIIPQPAPEVSEGDLMSFEVELRGAESATGGIDGPVELRVLRAPRGMRWTQLESANPQLSNRFRFDWETSPGDSGTHLFRIRGTSPTGIERLYETTLHVIEAKELVLTALGGDTQRATLALFNYQTDSQTQHTSLHRSTTIHLGQGIGQLAEARGYQYVTVPISGTVAVIDPLQGELLRNIPVKGEPYAITAQGDYIWVFDGRTPQLTVIDSRLKVYRRSVVTGLSSYIIAAMGIQTPEGQRLAVLSADQELWILNPEAFISNQPSRAVLQRFSLISQLPRLDESQHTSLPIGGGLLLGDSDTLIAYTPRIMAAFRLSELNINDLAPRWIMKSAASLNMLTIHHGELWAATSLGLRRFDWPADGSGTSFDLPPEEGVILELSQLTALVSYPSLLMGERALITASKRQLSHVSSQTLRSLLTTTDANPKALYISERSSR